MDREVGDEREDRVGGQTSPGDEVETNQCRHPRNWEAIMEEVEGLAFDDPHSDSDATVMGVDGLQGPELSSCDEPADSPPNTLRSLAPCSPGLPLVPTVAGVDTVEVHVTKEELDDV